jgi:hypothetical protein
VFFARTLVRQVLFLAFWPTGALGGVNAPLNRAAGTPMGRGRDTYGEPSLRMARSVMSRASLPSQSIVHLHVVGDAGSLLGGGRPANPQRLHTFLRPPRSRMRPSTPCGPQDSSKTWSSSTTLFASQPEKPTLSFPSRTQPTLSTTLGLAYASRLAHRS